MGTYIRVQIFILALLVSIISTFVLPAKYIILLGGTLFFCLGVASLFFSVKVQRVKLAALEFNEHSGLFPTFGKGLVASVFYIWCLRFFGVFMFCFLFLVICAQFINYR